MGWLSATIFLRQSGILNVVMRSATMKRQFNVTSRRRLSSNCYAASTIFALSTGYVKSAIAVFRVSGAKAGSVMSAISGFKGKPQHGRAYVRKLRNPNSGQLIDTAVLLWFQAPNSFTGEDILEVQCHGSLAVIRSLSSAISSVDGVRPAEAGEFARRAFLNKKMDLVEAESLADLIDAETDIQLDQAIKGGGLLSASCNRWMASLKEALANFETYIDFSDDQNISADEVLDRVRSLLANTQAEMVAALRSAPQGEAIRSGLRVAITGRPNVGKSTLINLLSRQEISIVSPIAGTTRDLVRVSVDLDGLPIVLCDTAGARHSSNDPVEAEGIRRAKEFSRKAHLNILVTDDPRLVNDDRRLLRDRNDSTAHEGLELDGHDCIVVLNKVDLLDGSWRGLSESSYGVDFTISCLNGYGMEKLTKGIITRLRNRFVPDAPPLIVRERQRELIQEALSCIQHSLEENGGDAAVSAEFLRQATVALGKISGKVGAEDILDIIFSQFCIGK